MWWRRLGGWRDEKGGAFRVLPGGCRVGRPSAKNTEDGLRKVGGSVAGGVSSRRWLSFASNTCRGGRLSIAFMMILIRY